MSSFYTLKKDFLLFCLISISTLSAQAQYTLTIDDVTFDPATGTITEYINLTEKEIIIPSTFTIADREVSVETIGYKAFNRHSLISIIIPNSVKNIESSAFHGNNLTRLTIPNSVTNISSGAFRYNSLISVTIPNSITTISSYAFNNNNLTTLEIPNTVTNIEKDAFSYNNLTSLTLPNSITSIGKSAFYMNSLTTVNIPNSVTNIENYAFSYNNLTSLIIPNSISIINKGTFQTNSLTSVEIPNTVTNIEENAFSNNKISSIEIPNSTKTIGSYAFNNNNLTTLNIPNNVTNIEDYAFSYNNLTSLIISNNLSAISKFAFYMNSLTSVAIPNSVKSIGEAAFMKNELTTITIPNSVTYIDDNAFSTNKLTSVSIPNSVTKIGDGAFTNNAINEVNNLTSNGIIFARNTDGTEDYSAIVSYGGTASIIDFIPNTVTKIKRYSFSTCPISAVTIPNNVTTIEKLAFFSSSLTSINFGTNSHITSINELAFGNCTDLNSFTLPSNAIQGFTGYKDSNNNNYSAGDNISLFTPRYYVPDAYTINYVLNGGTSNNPSAYLSTHGIASFEDAKKDGYTFIGWYSDNAFNTEVVEITKGTTDNIVLYAKFDLTNTINSTNIKSHSIYPNPSNEQITLKGFSINEQLHIYSYTGELIMNLNNTTNTINISQLQKGLYFLQNKDGNCIKFIKE